MGDCPEYFTSDVDPVCRLQVTPETAAGKSEYKGRIYYFRDIGCKEEFDKNPEKYIEDVPGPGEAQETQFFGGG